MHRHVGWTISSFRGFFNFFLFSFLDQFYDAFANAICCCATLFILHYALWLFIILLFGRSRCYLKFFPIHPELSINSLFKTTNHDNCSLEMYQCLLEIRLTFTVLFLLFTFYVQASFLQFLQTHATKLSMDWNALSKHRQWQKRFHLLHWLSLSVYVLLTISMGACSL